MLSLLSRLTRPEKPETEEIRRAIAPYFDASFYLATYRDVADAGIDPLDHYIKHGAREGTEPGPVGPSAPSPKASEGHP